MAEVVQDDISSFALHFEECKNVLVTLLIWYHFLNLGNPCFTLSCVNLLDNHAISEFSVYT